MKIIIDNLEEADKEQLNALKNYLRSHELSFEVVIEETDKELNYLSTNLKDDRDFDEQTSYRLKINKNRNGNYDLINVELDKVVCEFQNNEVEQ